jgi:hypothetical protein
VPERPTRSGELRSDGAVAGIGLDLARQQRHRDRARRPRDGWGAYLRPLEPRTRFRPALRSCLFRALRFREARSRAVVFFCFLRAMMIASSGSAVAAASTGTALRVPTRRRRPCVPPPGIRSGGRSNQTDVGALSGS